MPPHTTTPPLRDAFSAAGTRAPTGAKMMAASTGAEQRRCFGVAVAIGQMKAVARVCDRVRGIAAIDLVAGKARAIAEILLSVAAIGAGAVGRPEPRHADPVADGEPLHLGANRLD